MANFREETCRYCKQPFQFRVKRGRPPLTCLPCRTAQSDGVLKDRLISLGVGPEQPDTMVAFAKKLVEDYRADHPDLSSSPDLVEGHVKSGDDNRKAHAEKVIDQLEEHLLLRGTHIKQHRDKW